MKNMHKFIECEAELLRELVLQHNSIYNTSLSLNAFGVSTKDIEKRSGVAIGELEAEIQAVGMKVVGKSLVIDESSTAWQSREHKELKGSFLINVGKKGTFELIRGTYAT